MKVPVFAVANVGLNAGAVGHFGKVKNAQILNALLGFRTGEKNEKT